MPRKLKQPLEDENFLNKVITRSREKSDVLGDLCKYEVEDIEILPADLDRMISKYGLGDYSPVDIRKKTAARKAITRVRKLLEDPDSDLRVIVRPVHTNEEDVVRYAIIDEHTDLEDLDLDYSTRNQVIFRKDTETIEFTKNEVPEILDEFDHLCSVYTDAEVGRMIKNIINTHGIIHLQDRSGMFFIPRSMKDMADALVKLFDDFSEYSEKCYFRPIAIMDDEQNRATMGEALLAEVTAELAEAKFQLEKAVEEESIKTMNSALTRFKIANGKAKLYEDMLKLNLTDVQKVVKEAHDVAGELLTKITADREAKKKEKSNG